MTETRAIAFGEPLPTPKRRVHTEARTSSTHSAGIPEVLGRAFSVSPQVPAKRQTHPRVRSSAFLVGIRGLRSRLQAAGRRLWDSLRPGISAQRALVLSLIFGLQPAISRRRPVSPDGEQCLCYF
jgi:hypothetical protein